MSKVPETLNLKTAREWLKNKKVNLKIKKPKTKKQKSSLKKISKTATLSLLAIPLIVDWRILFFIIGNIALYIWYRHTCSIIDNRKALRIAKMQKYENKPEGVKKRMANLKQFKNPT